MAHQVDKVRFCAAFLILLVFAWIPAFSQGFVQHSIRIHGIRSTKTCLTAGSTFSASEVEDMEKLILSLSKEQSDSFRRKRVASIFSEQIIKPNGAAKRFSILFGKVLQEVGDRVKLKAEKKFRERLKDNQENLMTTSSDGQENSGVSIKKSMEENQLWALIDMMVQSKTIMKKTDL